jgi:chemotaxis protein CheX
MATLTEATLAQSLAQHTANVCQTMLNVAVTQREPSDRSTSPVDEAETVVALIGLTGTWNGSGTIACAGATARHLSGRFLMTEFAAVDAEVLDAMGELANMIIGNVKEDLATALGPLAISTPTVIHGRGLQTRSVDGETDACVSFACEGGVLDVRVSLVPAAPRG